MSYHDDDEGGSWVEKICNDRNYLVIGDGESLVADWPGWLSGIAQDRQELFDEAEVLGLDGADYASPPNRDDDQDVEEFLVGLGVSVSSDFIERTGCSSHDAFAYVRKKAIPALQAREDRRIEASRRRLLKDAVKRLTPDPEASYPERFAALKRMLSAQEVDFIEKVERVEAAESAQRESADLVQRLRKVVESLNAEKEALEGSLAGEERRIEARLAQESRKLAKYEELVVDLRLRFGVTLAGPLLTFADGTGFLLTGVFGELLAGQEGAAAWAELAAVKSGQVQVLRLTNSFRVGFSRAAALDLAQARQRFGQRFAWSRAWWIVLNVEFGYFEGHFTPDKPWDFRVPEGRREEWRDVIRKSW